MISWAEWWSIQAKSIFVGLVMCASIALGFVIYELYRRLVK